MTDLMTTRVRLAYECERDALARRYSQRSYTLPPSWGEQSDVWARLVAFCKKQHIDPTRYVRWSMTPNQVLLDPPPEPNRLLAPAMMRDFAAYLERLTGQLQLRYAIERRAAKTEFVVEHKFHGEPYEVAARAAVAGGHLPLSPLFRFALALEFAMKCGSKKLTKMAGRQVEGAMLQYSFHPVEYAALYPSLPPFFAEEASNLYDRMIGLTDPARDRRE